MRRLAHRGRGEPVRVYGVASLGGRRHTMHPGRLERRIALVGFDDVQPAGLLEPGVTVVAQDPARIGELAATTLFRRLDRDRGPTVRYVVDTTLIARGSGEMPPSRV